MEAAVDKGEASTEESRDRLVLGVFESLEKLVSLKKETANLPSKKALVASDTESAPPTLRKGKKHLREVAKKEVQLLLCSLDGALGGARDEPEVQARLYQLFRDRLMITNEALTPMVVQNYLEALQSYIDHAKSVSWQKKLSTGLLQYLQDNREDPDNSLVGLAVRKGILDGLYEEANGVMQLCEGAAGKRSSSRRTLTRGSLALVFPVNKRDTPDVAKVDGSKKNRRRTRKISSNLQEMPRDLVLDAVKIRSKTQKLKNSWRASMDILRLQRVGDEQTQTKRQSGGGMSLDVKGGSKLHKRAKSGSSSSVREHLEIVRTSSPGLAEGDSSPQFGRSNSGPSFQDTVSASQDLQHQKSNQSNAVSREPTDDSSDVHSDVDTHSSEERSGSESAAHWSETEEGTTIDERGASKTTDQPADESETLPVFGRVLYVHDGRALVALRTRWPQNAIDLPCSRVLPLHSDLQSFLSNSRSMAQLVDNPLEDWYAGCSKALKNRMERFIEERGVDVSLMKQAAKQQEGDIKTLRFLLQCKATLEEIIKHPPTELLEQLSSLHKSELAELVDCRFSVFLPGRNALVQFLTDMDYCKEAMRTVRANLQNIDTALEQVALEKVRLLNGTRKEELSRWWLREVSSMCTAFLERLGFVEEAVPENYIETPPSDVPAVRRNLQLIQGVLDRNADIHGVKELIAEVKALVYGRIDSFLEDMLLALAAEFDQLDELPFSLHKARECMYAQKESMDEEKRRVLENVIKDVEYICRMKEIEEEEQGGQLKLADVVPISGLVMSSFHRRENVLKTVIELWGAKKTTVTPVNRFERRRASTVGPHITAMDITQTCIEALSPEVPQAEETSLNSDSISVPIVSSEDSETHHTQYLQRKALDVLEDVTSMPVDTVSPESDETTIVDSDIGDIEILKANTEAVSIGNSLDRADRLLTEAEAAVATAETDYEALAAIAALEEAVADVEASAMVRKRSVSAGDQSAVDDTVLLEVVSAEVLLFADAIIAEEQLHAQVVIAQCGADVDTKSTTANSVEPVEPCENVLVGDGLSAEFICDPELARIEAELIECQIEEITLEEEALEVEIDNLRVEESQ